MLAARVGRGGVGNPLRDVAGGKRPSGEGVPYVSVEIESRDHFLIFTERHLVFPAALVLDCEPANRISFGVHSSDIRRNTVSRRVRVQIVPVTERLHPDPRSIRAFTGRNYLPASCQEGPESRVELGFCQRCIARRSLHRIVRSNASSQAAAYSLGRASRTPLAKNQARKVAARRCPRRLRSRAPLFRTMEIHESAVLGEHYFALSG